MTETVNISSTDIQALSYLVYYEADNIRAYYQNQGYSQQQAMTMAFGTIVDVVINRVALSSTTYGSDIQSVINSNNGVTYQFTALPDNSATSWDELPPIPNGFYDDIEDFIEQHIADRISGAPSTVGPATHYYNPTISSPSWGDDMAYPSISGDGGTQHQFGVPKLGDGSPGPLPQPYILDDGSQESDPIDPIQEPKVPDACPVPEGWFPPLDDGMGQAPLLWSPLVIDMDNDGIELTSLATDAVYWDIDSDGLAEASAWVDADDALLAIDLNEDGMINNHSELFGNEITDGFTMLSVNDSNSDDVINSSDTNFSKILVWQDLNQDGLSQSSELKTLTQAGIASINLNASFVNYTISGNPVTHQSTVTMADTSTRTVVDAWFNYDNSNSIYVGDFVLDVRTIFLPTLRGLGDVKDLYVQMSLDEDLLDQVSTIASADVEDLLDPTFNVITAFKDILYRWAGVHEVDAVGIQTEDFTRKVEFLDTLTGKNVYEDGYTQGTAQINFIDRLWVEPFNNLLAGFLVQTTLNQIFEGDVTYNSTLGVIENFEGLSEDVLDDIADVIDNSNDPVFGWATIVRFIEGAVGINNLSDADYGVLDTLITTSLTDLDLPALHAAVSYPITDLINDDTVDNLFVLGTSGNDGSLYSVGYVNKIVVGNAGNDALGGGTSNEVYIGGVGNDTYIDLYGGDDVYIYQSGNDQNQDQYSSTYGDKLVMGRGIELSDLSMQRVNMSDPYSLDIWNQTHLAINVDGKGSVKLVGQYQSNGLTVNGIETLQFADGSTLDLTTLSNPIEGTYGNDTLTGLDRAFFLYDRLEGSYGNDTLNGGLGHNLLKGGADNDTYIYGGGLDTIIDDTGTDQIVFANTYNPSLFDIVYDPFQYPTDPVANTMKIYYDSELVVRIYNATGFGYNFVESLVIDGITTIDLTALDHSQHGTSGNDTIHGYDAYAWENSTIYGLEGDDYIYGRGGSDLLYGNEGVDYILGDTGNDEIYGGDGNDTIDGGYDNDQLYGDAGNDSIWGSYGIDTIYGGAGSDTVNAGTDNDTAVYVYSENTSATDTYRGNEGTDRLDLYFQSSELTETIKADILTYRNYINDVANINTSAASGAEYQFTSFGLNAGRFETYKLYVNSVEVVPAVDGKADGFVAGSEVVYNGNLLADNGNGVDVGFINTLYAEAGTYSTTQGGTIVISSNGGFTYTSATSFVGTDTFTYTVNDGYGTSDTALAMFNVLATTTGTTGNNTLNGSSSDNYISALAGNDTINASLGEDVLDGGDGTDTVTYTGYGATSGITVDFRGATHKVMKHNGSVDILIGIEKIYATSYDDTIYATDNVIYSGTSGIYYAGAGNDTLYGGLVADALNGENGNDILYGGDGNNNLVGGSGNDEVYGGAGDDSLVSGAGVDIIDGGSGTDEFNLYQGNQSANVNLSTGIISNDGFGEADTIINVEDIMGTIYADTITGSTANNVLDGHTGNDTIYGLSGNDTLYGRNGDDTLYGGDGDDLLEGGGDNDTLYGDNGNDTLRGGPGNDTYIVDSTSDIVNESNNSGTATDSVQASATYTLSNYVEHLTLTGSSAINGTGNSLANIIFGNSGDNTLNGNGGDDILQGGDGLDTLTGSYGADTFVFEAASAFNNIDIISDFNTGQSDKLNISDLLSGYAPGTSDINDFMSLTTGSGNTSVLIDRDGTGGTYSNQSIASLIGVTGLDVDDLLNNGNLIV